MTLCIVYTKNLNMKNRDSCVSGSHGAAQRPSQRVLRYLRGSQSSRCGRGMTFNWLVCTMTTPLRSHITFEYIQRTNPYRNNLTEAIDPVLHTFTKKYAGILSSIPRHTLHTSKCDSPQAPDPAGSVRLQPYYAFADG